MDAAVAEVPVEAGGVAVAIDQRLELAKVVAEAQRIDRRVLPADDRVGIPRVQAHRGGRGPLLADAPERGDRRGFRRLHHRDDPIGVGHRRVERRAALGERPLVGRGDLGQQPRAALGQQRDLGEPELPVDQPADDAPVEPLHRDRGEGQDLDDGVTRDVDLGEAEHEQALVGRVLDQPQPRPEDRHAGPLRADQRAGDVKAVLRQELIEVVARHAPLDGREALADRRRVLVPDRDQLTVDRRPRIVPGEDPGQRRLVRRADPEARPVRRQHLELDDVLDRLAGQHRVRPAGVVADHPAERAAAVRRRVRPEGQPDLLGHGLQRVADHPGLDQSGARLGVDLEHPVQVARTVEHQRLVHALPVLRGAAAAHQERQPVLAAERGGGDDVVDARRADHAERHLAVVGGVARVEGAGGVGEVAGVAEGAGQGGAQGGEGGGVAGRGRCAGGVGRRGTVPGHGEGRGRIDRRV